MTRRRLQRLAMEWTVALTNSDIPAELRRLSPAVDGGLGDLRFARCSRMTTGIRCRQPCGGAFPNASPAGAR